MMINSLQSVLRRQWAQTQGLDKTPYAGAEEKRDKPLTDAEARELRDDLNAAIRRNKPILWILFALIALLLLATVYTAFAHARSQGGLEWVSATSGGILAFLIPAAMKVWREVTKLEMMAAIATRVQGEALTGLIRLILEGQVP